MMIYAAKGYQKMGTMKFAKLTQQAKRSQHIHKIKPDNDAQKLHNRISKASQNPTPEAMGVWLRYKWGKRNVNLAKKFSRSLTAGRENCRQLREKPRTRSGKGGGNLMMVNGHASSDAGRMLMVVVLHQTFTDPPSLPLFFSL